MKYYQLTHPSTDRAFHERVAENINNDYPGEAIVVNPYGDLFCVKITETYWEFCRNYVQENCKIKPEGVGRPNTKAIGIEVYAG